MAAPARTCADVQGLRRAPAAQLSSASAAARSAPPGSPVRSRTDSVKMACGPGERLAGADPVAHKRGGIGFITGKLNAHRGYWVVSSAVLEAWRARSAAA